MVSLIAEELDSCTKELDDKQRKLTTIIKEKQDIVPEQLLNEGIQLTEESKSLIGIPLPSGSNKIVLHFVGSSSSFKTSLVLDLFAYEPLTRLLGAGKTAEHTAVPCLIEPIENTKSGVCDFYKIDNSGNETSIENEHEFSALYEIDDNVGTNYNYFLKINVPKKQVSFQHTIIEYPGIETPDKKVKQTVRQRQVESKQNMLRCIKTYPGIIVACYATKVRLPAGDPISEIFNENRDLINKYKASSFKFKLPLILSLNGRSLVESYINCNDDITETIDTYFNTISEDFSIKVAFVNPKNKDYGFDVEKVLLKNNNKYSWVERSSIYSNIDQAIQSISKDGGIAFARNYYSELVEGSAIPELITDYYIRKALEVRITLLDKVTGYIRELKKYDTCLIIQENIRLASIATNGYKTISELYDIKNKNTANNNINMWSEIISDYIKQFLKGSGLTSNDDRITEWLRIYIITMCNDQGYDENSSLPINNEDTLSFNFIDDFSLLFKNILSLQISNMIKRCDPNLQFLLKKEGKANAK